MSDPSAVTAASSAAPHVRPEESKLPDLSSVAPPHLAEPRQQPLLEAWNASQTDYPDQHCVHQLFEAQTAQTPDAIALVFVDSGGQVEQLTYQALNARANQVAHELRRCGLGKRDEMLVGICLPRSLELVIALLGVLKAGGTYLPLDPVYPAERLHYMLQDAQAALVITEEQLLERLPHDVSQTLCLDRERDQIARLPETNLDSRATPDHLAYVMYTSGSTGRPKGVMIPHRGLCNLSQFQIRHFELMPADRVLQFASFSFDAAIWEIVMALLSGASLYLAGAETLLPGPALTQLLRDHAITVATLPPAVLAILPETDLPALRTIVSAGEACPAAIVERWSPGRAFFNAYGPTEATVCATISEPLHGNAKPPIGRPLANTQVYLLDEQLHPVAVGVPGELYIGSAGLARGYLNRPELTAERFVPDPFTTHPGSRLYRTGDLACYQPDGTIAFIGRIDFQVKLRGFRIELGEIEAALEQHPAVAEAVVLAREDMAGNKRLVAYVVENQEPRTGCPLGDLEPNEQDKKEPGSTESPPSPVATEVEAGRGSGQGGWGGEGLRSFLAQRLPEHMLPSVFVTLDAFPLSANGKVDRAALPAPDTARPELEQAFVAPRTPTEIALAELWSQVLGLSRIGVHDQFFVLGGHSLAVTQVVARVREQFQVELALNSLFAAPTIAEFAQLIGQAVAGKRAGAATTIRPVPRDRPLPLSFAQEQVWLLQELNPENQSYSAQATMRFSGTLDVAVLRASLGEIVRRHEIFRTTFPLVDGSPVQLIHEPWPVPLPVLDLEPLPSDERDAALSQAMHAEFYTPFDVNRLPLVRWRLVRLSADEHVLIHVEHHFVHDGWSYSVFLHELLALYQARLEDMSARLPDLSIQFADFVVWQREWMEQAEAAEQLAFWRANLAASPPLLELPTDYPRPSVQRFRGSSVRIELPPALSDAAREFARAEGVTLFMALLTTFTTLMQRYSRQHDFNIGSGVANRRWRETEALIGMIVNMVVLRMQTANDLTFRDLLGRARDVALAAYAHQDLPFERVVEALQPRRNLSYNPIFQVAFSFHDSPLPDLELPGLTIDVNEALSNGSAKFDLNVVVIPRSEQRIGRRGGSHGITMVWEYNTDLFSVETIRRMTEHFQTILATMIADPEQSIVASSLLTAAERQQLLIDWNATEAEYPAERCVHELFEIQAEQRPDTIAVVAGKDELSYGQLNARANQLAHELLACGVGPDVPVGVCVERSLDLVIALLGILKAGGGYVPLDPSYPEERLQFMVGDSRISVLVTQSSLRDKLVVPTVICLDSDHALLDGQPITNPRSGAVADNLCYITYTSGSTGIPKGVVIPHRGVTRLVFSNSYADFSADAVWLHTAPIAFDASTFELWGSLLHGAQLVLLPPGTPTPDEIARLVRRHGVSTIWLTTALFHQMAESEHLEELRQVRQILTGGDVLSVSLAAHVRRALPDCRLVNAYGPTESTTFTSCYQLVEQPQSSRPIPIGRPLANTTVYVLDAQLQPVPVGVPGQLYIGGDGLARGYLDRPALTAEKFVPYPLSATPGARLYATGDLARYLPDGNLEFLGRIDTQVKLRGYRIELGEIQAVLSQHPAVHETIVVARADRVGEKRLVAYVVGENLESRTQNQTENREQRTKEQSTTTPLLLPQREKGVGDEGLATSLRAFLRQRLPEYMIPGAFVMLDAFPLNASGKFDLRALPEPDWSGQTAQQVFVPPRSAVEQTVGAIWSQLLGVERVSVHDSFFDLGGHSLLATQLLSRIRSAFQLTIPLHALFDTPTIAEIAELIERSQAAAVDPGLLADLPLDQAIRQHTPPIERRRQHDGPLPLSFAQQRLWFLDQLEPGNAAYNICRSIVLSGDLNVAALDRSLNALIQRHESLRTIFGEHDGQPVQIILPSSTVPLPLLDLSHLPEPEREAIVREQARSEARQSFDLTRAPLVRWRLLRLDSAEHVLILTLHHSICDGWSMGVLFGDLAALYEQALAGQPDISTLPPLPIQYADYAVWQRAWLSGEVLEQQLSYWRNQLADSPALLLFPTDRPRPAVPTNRGALASRRLSRQLADDLHALSRREGVTLFMTLLAAFDVLLSRYSGQDDILVGSPIANRTRPESEPLIGLFVNTLVLRADLSGRPTFHELLRRVRDSALAAYDHQDLPFEKLVEELHPERDLTHTPLFQAMFILQNQQQAPRDLAGVALRMSAEDTGTTAFDLTLSIEEQPDGLLAEMQYSSELFDAATIERLLEHLAVLLAEVIAAPEQSIARLLLLSAAEEQQLTAWNQTCAPYPAERCIHELIAEQAGRTPDAIAVTFGDQQLSYAELDRRANQVAWRLRELGAAQRAPAEVIVALCLPRSLDLIVALLGVLKAGAAYLPLDPALPQERLHFIMHDAQVQVLLSRQDLADRIQIAGVQIICLDRDETQTQPTMAPAIAVLPQHPAYVIYTSGSTGRPKGVLIPHQALVARSQAAADQYALQPGDRVLQFAALSFDVAAEEIFPTLICGATLVLWPQTEVVALREFQRFVEHERLTVLNLPMPYWHAWVADLDAAPLPLPSSLRLLIAGSDQTAPDWLARWQRRAGTGLPWYNAYGPTEATITSTLYTEADAALAAERGAVPIGRPIANTEVYVLDAELQRVPIGVPGELYLGGPGLARGYLSQPALTAERFVPDPFGQVSGARLYRTGDRARFRADGNLEFLGRIDQQVKLRGFRIELGEIENVLLGHPAVAAAVVEVREVGAGDTRLVAYVVENKGTTEQENKEQRTENTGRVTSPSPAAAGEGGVAAATGVRASEGLASHLHTFLQERLPAYMVPAAFVLLDALPLTASGKLDRRALPLPADLRATAGAEHTAPRTPLEVVLAEIWAELLSVEQPGAHDNFFKLGGHSLLATQVVARIREDLEIELPLRRIFETPTIAGLAESLRRDPAQAEHVDKVARLIVQLAQMSEAEAEAMLTQTQTNPTRNATS
ncbi:MAG TPA: amino acid adenylation domain-containing protein [Herpetosiphonaceae bacterium]